MLCKKNAKNYVPQSKKANKRRIASILTGKYRTDGDKWHFFDFFLFTDEIINYYFYLIGVQIIAPSVECSWRPDGL